jgi:4-aminobutyrate aminotransferase-like enzyme
MSTSSMLSQYQLKRDYYACPCDETRMYPRFMLPEKAQGMWIWFEGEEDPYMDLVLNFCSVNFGHCHPVIVNIVKQVAEQVDQIHSFHSSNKLELSEYLARKVSADKQYKVYFNIGGSAAVSDALRLCRLATGKQGIISFHGAFHGVSDAAVSVTDDRLVAKHQYGIPVAEHTFFAPFPGSHTSITVAESLAAVEKLIDSQEIAGVIVEPIQGAGGFILPQDAFLSELSALCKRHGVNLIIDEIQVGFGRAGSFFVFQHYGVTDPDIVLLSKSIGGGYFPVSAVIARADLFDPVPVRGTAFQSTFNNSSLGLGIANRLMKWVEEDNIFAGILDKGQIFLEKLSFLNDSPFVANLRGLGYAMAFDIVEPHSRRPSADLARLFVDQCLKNRVIIYACGVHFNSVKIIPSLLATDEEIALIVERLRTCLEQFHKVAS